ncbi:hypothetical protein [Myceligenerans crystallogenes]|uniref:Dolichyl-phosphate-mannose-protein mannosyltransferase n=1 Tax=Myceligenerans crystallogenes TaxID=316335 RepID=A0ABN2NK01_9MICO
MTLRAWWKDAPRARVPRAPARFRAEVLAEPGRAGVVAAAACAVLLSLAVLVTDPPYGTGDEPAHVDYAWQVWHGGLPVFEEGLAFRPAGAELPPVQWTAQHPPLYYLLVSWLVGPLADAGHPVAAVYAARVVNVLLAGAFVLVARWSAGRVCRPGSPLPQLAAMVAGTAAAVAHVGGAAFNDLVAALCVTTMFGAGATAIRRGLDLPLVAGLSLLMGAGALSRLSAAMTGAVIVAFVVAAAAVRAARGRGRWAPVVALAVGGPTTALAAAGWFYARNLALTGNLQGSHFDWAMANQLQRVARPVWQVVLDPVTWARLPDFFWWAGRVAPTSSYAATTLAVTSVLLLWIPLVLGLVPGAARVLRASGGLGRRLRRGGGAFTTGRASGKGGHGDRGLAGSGHGVGASAAGAHGVGASAAGAHGVGASAGGGARATAGASLPGAGRWVRAMLWTTLLVAVSVQVVYGANGGSLFPRYLLPVALPVFLGVAAGLARRPRLLVPLWGAVATANFVSFLVAELATPAKPGLYAEPTALAVAVGVLAVCGSVAATLAARRALSADPGRGAPGLARPAVPAGAGAGPA